LAAELRRHVLLPEDLGKFSEKEISLLAGALKAEEWATALFELPAEVRTKLKAQMADRTWQMIEQSMSYGNPSREKIEEALGRVMAAAAAFIKEGKILNPSDAPQPMIEGGQAGA
jgi:flagellar motor switch protein FliG